MTEQEYNLPYRVHFVPITGPSIETSLWACNRCCTVHPCYEEALECTDYCDAFIDKYLPESKKETEDVP